VILPPHIEEKKDIGNKKIIVHENARIVRQLELSILDCMHYNFHFVVSILFLCQNGVGGFIFINSSHSLPSNDCHVQYHIARIVGPFINARHGS